MARSRVSVFLFVLAVTDGDILPRISGSYVIWGYVRSSPLRRDSSRCSTGEYFHGGLCCQRCPAGTHTAAHCQKDHGESQCSPCISGKDFTAYPNGLTHCLTCRSCRDDQDIMKECTPTSDAVCRCKPGTYCPLRGSCEICHPCRSCPGGVKEACTETANAICVEDPIQDKNSESKPPDEGSSNIIIVAAVLVPVLVCGILIGLCIYYRKKMNCNVCSTSLPGQGSEKERLSISETSLASNWITPKLPDKSPHDGEPDPAVQKTTGNEGNSTAPEREGLLQASDESRPPYCDVLTSQREVTADEDSGVSVRLEVSEIGPADCEDNRDLAVTSRNPTRRSHVRCPPPPAARVPDDQPVNLCAKTCASRLLSSEDWSTCFYCFIEEVSLKDWKRFMRTVKLDNNSIERIEFQHLHSVQEQQYHMLVEWHMQHGSTVCVHTLLDALSEMKFEGCRENVVNALRSKDLFFLV